MGPAERRFCQLDGTTGLPATFGTTRRGFQGSRSRGRCIRGMSYRELSMIEVKEILRLWLQGRSLREVTRLTGVDHKTVRRNVETARACGVDRDGGTTAQLTDELLGALVEGAQDLTSGR